MLNKLEFISAQKNNFCALIGAVQSRSYSQDFKIINNADPAHLKRGSGGRSSFNGNVVTVFGATGFLGRYICNQLGKRGTQIIIPHRSDPDNYEVKKLKLVGDLGQVLFQPFDVRDLFSIRKAIKYSNIVINLIGSDIETRNFNYYDVHVTAAREIARACKEFNVEKLIHFSALNVTENPEKYYVKKLQFLPSKLKGEEAVLEEFPNATIFRPSVCYGFMDKFLWPLCDWRRKTVMSIPLYKKGEKTIKQPVYAPDVALGVINAINDNGSKGKIYQAVGPERFYMKDIALFCAQILQRQAVSDTLIHDLHLDPFFFAKIFFVRYISGFFWNKPKHMVCFEHIERESVTDVVDPELPTLEDLGVLLSKMEDRIPYLILPFFITNPDGLRLYEDYYAADSLSIKAVKEYS